MIVSIADGRKGQNTKGKTPERESVEKVWSGMKNGRVFVVNDLQKQNYFDDHHFNGKI